MKFFIADINEIQKTAIDFLKNLPNQKIFAFHGDLGAGKTTFIKALCEKLGVKDQMSSPSFSIVNEYNSENGNSIYHFDLYRLKSPQEAFDIGMEEYLYSGNYCFIEWPERAEGILPKETVHVKMVVEDGRRIISVD
ncbi:MAG: tRNA (adenosine(37)-N6)-threonylcarbamoyltransferase complex ATPase subunit type 1 TsaE [Bacteroidetes bacterium]|nr:tRNA (adenosine(37)-N6)-threonylcarbamoyltransferase complex ATPase subunit type 1 TsaE [Bacteroidota bacterium]